MEVKIYSTQICPWCVKAKDYLKSKKITYKEYDVGEDDKARKEMIDKSGQMGVPVLDIGGRIIVGFNQAAIDEALASGK
ncbi:glutathione S-transferase N-terminal domain-containing protein [Candidatus Woesearchaeota archaeon]|nr:glutathione S-transferase N-terminal domain-containing protein [Candidatus Woesearchaeota archaeon]HIH39094.1 NrdH-redoxin [Candidatus Woesearchaeota archaeon]HIH49374.1 NrdH-redoxin [Candidatus Woesearchaeota archaeon]HIJ04405.1 NrdH-redoxin [Candidatus Woesearchaeota archaeon]